MDVGVGFVLAADGVGGDVEELVAKVFCVADSVFVVVVLPDWAGVLGADGEGEAPLDELGGFFDGFGWGEECVQVVGHDDEAVELEFVCVAVAEESFDHQFRHRSFLEDA